MFSLQLEASTTVSVAANYFNDNLSEWEPLIEMIEDDKKKGMKPWELAVKVRRVFSHYDYYF